MKILDNNPQPLFPNNNLIIFTLESYFSRAFRLLENRHLNKMRI